MPSLFADGLQERKALPAYQIFRSAHVAGGTDTSACRSGVRYEHADSQEGYYDGMDLKAASHAQEATTHDGQSVYEDPGPSEGNYGVPVLKGGSDTTAQEGQCGYEDPGPSEGNYDVPVLKGGSDTRPVFKNGHYDCNGCVLHTVTRERESLFSTGDVGGVKRVLRTGA